MQLTMDDQSEFTEPALWGQETKTPETLRNARCACCGKAPDSIKPLDAGWGWDTMEPTNPWLWCPKCSPTTEDE